MTPRPAIGAAALVLACAVATLAGDEEKAKRPGPQMLALRLEKDRVYPYVFTEKVHCWSKTRSPEREDGTDQKSETTWDLELRLVEAKEGGGAVVALTVKRVRGTYESNTVPKREFDHAGGDGRTLGGETRVTLSAAGRVLEVEGTAVDSIVKDASAPELARRATVERFFQSLPTTPLRVGVSWQETRVTAPDMVGSGQHVNGEFVEKAVVKKTGPVVAAALSAKGKDKQPRRKPGQKGDAKKAAVGVLEEWSLSGEVTIDAETGLAKLRTTHVETTRYSDFIAVRDVTLEAFAEYDTRLEAVAPK